MASEVYDENEVVTELNDESIEMDESMSDEIESLGIEGEEIASDYGIMPGDPDIYGPPSTEVGAETTDTQQEQEVDSKEQPTNNQPTRNIYEGSLMGALYKNMGKPWNGPEGPNEAAQNIVAVPTGIIDTVTDALEWLADPEGAMDGEQGLPRIPAFESKTATALRSISGLAIPSLGLRGMLLKTGSKLHKAAVAPMWAQKLGNRASFQWFSRFGADVFTGGAVDYVAKQNQYNHNLARMLQDYWPQTFQWIPSSIVTGDNDGADQIRAKNVAEGAIFNIFASIIEGAAILLKADRSLARTGRFIPENELAEKNLARLTEVDTKVYSENPIENAVLKNEAAKEKELDLLGQYYLEKGQPLTERTLGVHDAFDQNETLIRTATNDGGVNKAAVDAAQIAYNVDSNYGRLGSIVTDASLQKGLEADSLAQRTLLKGIAAELKDGGKYSRILASGKKIDSEMIDTAGKRLSEVLLDPRSDTGQMMEILGDFKRVVEDAEVSVVNRAGYRGVVYALRGLKETLFDLDAQKARAYLVTSMAGQSADFSEGVRLMDDSTAFNRAVDQIADRIEYLMVEKGLAAYEAGSALANMNIVRAASETGNPKVIKAASDGIMGEHSSRIAELIPNAKNWSQTIRNTARANPQFVKSLLLANEFTDGNVDSMFKLHKYMQNKLGTWQKAVLDLEPEVPSMLNKAMWSNIYNSALSAFATTGKALVGNVGGLVSRTVSPILGSALSGDWATMRRVAIANFVIDDTLKNSLDHMKLVWKKTSTNPQDISYVVREDIALKNEQALDLVREYAKAAEESGEPGASVLLQIYENMDAMASDPWLRFGANNMTALDGFSRSVIANTDAKNEALLRVFNKGEDLNLENLQQVKKEILESWTDSNGMITNKGVEWANSEIALNLDSPLVDNINALVKRAPVFKTIFFFPRTSANVIDTLGKYSPAGVLSKQYQELWGPLGLRKLDTFTSQEIQTILEKRGLPFDQFAMERFRQIRAEVKGKVAIGTFFTSMFALSAFNGNCRGTGHYDGSRQRVRRKVGWEPKTCRAPDGSWFSYEWLGPLGDWGSMVADVVDNFDSLSEPVAEEYLKKLGFIFSSTITSKSILSNLEPLVDILKGNSAAQARFASSWANLLIPLGGQRNEIGRVLNPQMSDIKNDFSDLLHNRNKWIDAINPQGGLPGMTHFIDGKPIGYPENPFARWNNTYNFIKIYDDVSPESQFLIDIEYNINPQINTSSGGVELQNNERAAIMSLIGQQGDFKKDLQIIMKDANELEYGEHIGFVNILKAIRQGGISSEVIKTEKFARIFSRVRKAFRQAKIQAEHSLPEAMLGVIREREDEKNRVNYFTERGDLEEVLVPTR